MADFHPVVWMFDDELKNITYRYFKSEAIVEHDTTTYGDTSAAFSATSVSWNHGMAEIISSLLNQGLQLTHFEEYDYSPYDCFKNLENVGERKFRFKEYGDRLPLVYSIAARKPL